MALRALAALCAGVVGASGAAAAAALDAASDEVALLQVALSGASAARGGRGPTVSSFVSNSGFYCAEAPARVAEAALATFKAGPFGTLFNASFAHAGESCASRGFGLAAGEDPCFPGLQVFYLSQHGRIVMAVSIPTAQDNYGRLYGISAETVQLMTQCTCHPQSQVARATGDACSALDSVQGSWVHRDPADDSELMCDQGPYVVAARALATLKSSSQLTMHRFDRVAPVGCSELGFPVEFPPIDHCFPPMRIWTRTAIDTDAGIQRAQTVEEQLFSGGAEALARLYHLDPLLVNEAGCNCLPQSSVGRSSAARCAELGPAGRSPVRDFWGGHA